MLLRGVVPAYVETLCTALNELSARTGLTDNIQGGIRATLNTIRSSKKYQTPLVDTEEVCNDLKHEGNRHESFAGNISEEYVRSWSSELGLACATQKKLIKILCHYGRLPVDEPRQSVREL